MRSELLAFLREDDPAALPWRVQQLLPLRETDTAVYRSLLTTWNQANALANLLMYPVSIPMELSKVFFEKALESGPYLQLAAVVGLQEADTRLLFISEPALIARTLLVLIQRYKGSPYAIIAHRASVSLGTWYTPELIEEVSALVHDADPVLSHNASVLLQGQDEAFILAYIPTWREFGAIGRESA